MDMIHFWAFSTDADVIVLSETWLSKAVQNKVPINSYNIFRTDAPK